MNKPEAFYFCNKCGYHGKTSEHGNCDYFACTTLEHQYIEQQEKELTDLRARCEKAERVLQEPTETMLQAGYEAVQYEVSDPYPHIGETVWRAMSEQFFKETAK